MIRTFRPNIVALLIPVCLLLPLGSMHAQIQPNAVAILGEIGPGFYLGEFNSIDEPNFTLINGFDASVALKYNVASNFSLLGVFGTQGMSYVITNSARSKYALSFFGPLSQTTYPETNVAITRANNIRTTKFLVMGQSHFNPTAQFVPYFTLGIGYLSFSITNDNSQELPKNYTGSYTNGSIVMPLGVGGQFFLTDRLSVHGQALYYINSSDYLDGYAHYNDFMAENFVPGVPGSNATPSDYVASMMFGASFTIYQPERTFQPPPLARNEPEPNPAEPTPSSNRPPPADSDADGLSDGDEQQRFLTDPNDQDSDDDNLTDYEEVREHNTSPNNPDTDGDGLADGEEVMVYSTDPLDFDTDNDQLADGTEVFETHTNPLDPDSDGDGVIDGLDRCPNDPGPAELDGCPDGTPARPVANRADTSSPLAGIPEFIQVQERADFEGIYFQVNSDNFDFSRPETARNLWRLLSYMEQCDDLGVVIEGHSSSEGNPRWNQELSERRARRVSRWLVDNGIPERKILGTIGYAGRLPLVDEPSAGTVPASALETARRQNRRITALVRRPCR